MSASHSLVSELERLTRALGDDSAKISEISLPSVAQRIAKNLGVKNEEVAIMGLSTKWRHLHFLVPEALRNVGFIPLSSNSALAARTARDGRSEIINNFSAVRHASVFEGVKIGNEGVEAIQKIISAPVLADGKIIGIIQISRKGSSATNAGKDFTPDDLSKILAICKPLGKLMLHVIGE
jgi:hypothetical protein